MICPLSRANDLTAPIGSPGWDGHGGGGDDLHPGGRGASHTGAGSHLAGIEWAAIVAAGGGGVRGQGADPATATVALPAPRRESEGNFRALGRRPTPPRG